MECSTTSKYTYTYTYTYTCTCTYTCLNPSPNPLRANPDNLNRFFNTAAERTQGTSTNDNNLFDLVESLPVHEDHSFEVREVSYVEVLQEIKRLRADRSRGWIKFQLNS